MGLKPQSHSLKVATLQTGDLIVNHGHLMLEPRGCFGTTNGTLHGCCTRLSIALISFCLFLFFPFSLNHRKGDRLSCPSAATIEFQCSILWTVRFSERSKMRNSFYTFSSGRLSLCEEFLGELCDVWALKRQVCLSARVPLSTFVWVPSPPPTHCPDHSRKWKLCVCVGQ